jgi:cell division protein ZapE
MSPKIYYQHALTVQGFTADDQQAAIIDKLQVLYEQIISKQARSLARLRLMLKNRNRKTINGLYIWGSVGAGKTWLMDIFYQSLPGERKLRLHFHRFMQEIHQGLRELAGQANPLMKLAKRYAQRFDVICFDEFVVNDITDAMLLANLLAALFKQKVIFVATSNVAPDDLYRNGLQRELFLPAITCLKQHTQVLELASKTDYRLRVLEQAGIYYFPLNANAERLMQERFSRLTGGVYQRDSLLIAGRTIPVLGMGTDVVWFDFKVLCQTPRSQADYLEIAQSFHTVLLSNVPQIPIERDDWVTYLIQLIDVFYDARVKLIISAAVAITELYLEGRYRFAFQRTQSRLQEMQSHEYLQSAVIRIQT